MLLNHFRFIDLTQPLSSSIPTWEGSCGFCLKSSREGAFCTQQIAMSAGVGTHMDSPFHLLAQGRSIEKIPLEELIVPVCVIDVSLKADADYELSVQDVKEYEKEEGDIPPKALVIAYTGWSRFWSDPLSYRNVDEAGKMRFPAVSAEAAAFLLKREIVGMGIDTLSPDCTGEDFPVHHLLLKAGKYLIENVGDCSLLPARGAYVIALPLRVERGAESPVRMIGLIPSSL